MKALSDIGIVLASTSVYRRDLLGRLGIPIRPQAPRVDETPIPGEAPAALAIRLAVAKAYAAADDHSGALIVGSDQVADCGGRVLGKPGSIENARAQLSASSGREVTFHTAVCLLDTRTTARTAYTALDTTTVMFRPLGDAEIERYLERERPFDCAGSFKSEGLGIGLFESIESRDPTALIGLPLIAVCRLFRQAGVDPI